jgi:predicted kinase
MPLLIIISGPSCTGKTTLASRLSRDFRLPLFCKDTFKEMMYDVAAPPEGPQAIPRDFSRLLGRMSIECLRIVLEALLPHGVSLIIESPLDRALFSPLLNQFRERCEFRIVQVQLICDPDVLMERFIAREAADRHPGHQGMQLIAEGGKELRGALPPLDVEGELVSIDTTDFEGADYRSLYRVLTDHLKGT